MWIEPKREMADGIILRARNAEIEPKTGRGGGISLPFADTWRGYVYLDTGKSPALPLCKRAEGEGIIDLKKRARRETLTTLLAAVFTAMHWSFEGHLLLTK